MKQKRLTAKERALVKAKIQGKTNKDAYISAGYAIPRTENALKTNASKAVNRPHIQAAIDAALEAHGATPEWAVGQLMKVAQQDDELGAKRLAAKDILELHGWNKADRPTLQLDIKNAFFGGGRKIEDTTERHTIHADQITNPPAEQ